MIYLSVRASVSWRSRLNVICLKFNKLEDMFYGKDRTRRLLVVTDQEAKVVFMWVVS